MASISTTEPSAMMESPNWLNLPDELTANILQRLGCLEILKSSRKVCTTWRRICKDPSMWKVIVMHKSFDRHDEWNEDYVLETLTKKAVDLSCGELIDVSIECFGTDNLLDHIVLSSSKLKSLRLMRCLGVTGSGLSRAIKRAPQLEKIDLTYTITEAEEIEAIGRNCPRLNSFIVARRFGRKSTNYDDCALAIANNMPELRHLKLSDGDMTNDGLIAILNGCTHLHSLDVRKCPNLFLRGKFGKLCMGRIKDFNYSPIKKLWDF